MDPFWVAAGIGSILLHCNKTNKNREKLIEWEQSLSESEQVSLNEEIEWHARYGNLYKFIWKECLNRAKKSKFSWF